MHIKNKIVFISPFWNRNDHIGNYRVERFVRWLNPENYEIIIIWSGEKDRLIKKDKWDELEIRDPLRIFTRKINHQSSDSLNRKQTKRKLSFRHFIQKIVFYFDRDLVWSLVLINKAIVKNLCKDAKYIISSSPPESIHLASYLLSKKFKLKLIVDMRDGWIDEPMRHNIGKHSFKRMIEARWEFKVLKQASVIFVTSIIWKNLLVKRLPAVVDKTKVLTNAYPDDLISIKNSKERKFDNEISLLHAGRFTGTRSTNKMSILLRPLYDAFKSRTDIRVELVLLGNLLRGDLNELDYWKQQFDITNCTLITRDRMPREEMFIEITKVNGLLLLAVSKAFFPSKTFEYIKSAKPILAVTSKGSTIWEIGQNLPQMFLYDYTAQKPDYTPVEEFLKACQTGVYEYKIPEEYSEEYLSKIFLNTIDKIY